MNKTDTNTDAQDVQDRIFRGMTADERLEVWAGLWRLAKDLTDNKTLHEPNGSKKFFD